MRTLQSCYRFLTSKSPKISGLPPRYRDSVRAITPGLPLFLYNYSTHQLHGIFEVCIVVVVYYLYVCIILVVIELWLRLLGLFIVAGCKLWWH